MVNKKKDYNYKIRRIPQNSIGLMIIFKTDDDEFIKKSMSSEDYKKILGEAATFAQLHKAELRLFDNLKSKDT